MKRLSSLKYRITFLTAAGVLLISLLIIGYNAYILRIKDERVTHSLESTLSLYCNEVSTTFNNVESFLLTQCFMEEDMRKLSRPRDEMDRYLSMIDIYSKFSESIGNYNMLDGLFLYDAAHDVFIAQAKDAGTKNIREHMGTFLYNFDAMNETGSNAWFAVLIDKEYYFVKMYRLQQVYVASYIKVSTIIGSLPQIVLAKNDYAVMCDRNGQILDWRFSNDKVSLRRQKAAAIGGENYRILQVFSENNEFSFAILEDKGGIFRENGIMWSQLGLLAVGLIIIGGVSAFFIKSRFTIPIDNLVAAMNQLKGGNLDVNLSSEKQFDEFKVVNETFEEMGREIKKLKIDIYEEMLNKQKAELLHLQEQINPHFLTNCMNLIRNLSILGEDKKIEEASIRISKHMRYSFAPGGMVSIEKELEHVRNYEALQRMRFGDKMDIQIDVPADLLPCYVPIMLIQTFVDNSLKHQLDPEAGLKIEIKAWRLQEGKTDDIKVSIKDNGEGFSENILRKLQNHEKIVNETGDHIGIYNVCQRLDILYEKEANIVFYNEGGACVEVYLPDRKKAGNGKID